MDKITFNFKKGDYINCSELSTEQVQMILDRMWDLGAERYEGICAFYEPLNNLVWAAYGTYFTGCSPEAFVGKYGYEGEIRVLTWEGIVESSKTVKRVKTIDLERKGGTTTEVLDSGILCEGVRYTESMLSNLIGTGRDLVDAVGEPFLEFYVYDDREIQWEFKYEFYKESTEDHEARVRREKELNDMYNSSLQALQKELLEAKTKIRELEDKL